MVIMYITYKIKKESLKMTSVRYGGYYEGSANRHCHFSL